MPGTEKSQEEVIQGLQVPQIPGGWWNLPTKNQIWQVPSIRPQKMNKYQSQKKGKLVATEEEIVDIVTDKGETHRETTERLTLSQMTPRQEQKSALWTSSQSSSTFATLLNDAFIDIKAFPVSTIHFYDC